MTLSASHLVKSFRAGGKETRAVDDLSFDLAAGEAVAFLGPNGAGKSTTIKMLCGILTPTAGQATVAGHPAGSLAANKHLGLVFGTRSQLFMHMTVRQCLDLIAEIYFVTGAEKRRRIQELAALFDLPELLDKRVRSLSLGQRMRCEVVAALVHRPRILLADEPTIGLDAVAKNRLRELISRWQREEGSTLLLTSHDLSDVEALCSRCILIDHGKKQYDGPIGALKGDLADLRRIQITVSDATVAPLMTDEHLVSLGGDAFVHRYEVRTDALPMSAALGRLSARYGDRLQDIQITEVSLEEVLTRRYQGAP